MIAAPTPAANVENERLRDLRALGILDTAPEERFDRIVGIARRVFGVPIAYIALVDSSRQWFKAQCGLRETETERDTSFCAHAILQTDVMHVRDAREDPRFHDNPLVTGEPFIRFYAGQPLAGPGGANVGTLCIASTEPRDLTDHERGVLRDLAALAEHELRMHGVIAIQQELIETRRALDETREQLARELTDAAAFFRSVLPAPIRPGFNSRVATDWVFESSSQLGGDAFGYHWIDGEHFAVYLIDVVGHGVASSLLSMAVHSTLRRGTLSGARFDDPGDVLRALNAAYPMEAHDGKFFSIWYGVFDRAERVLRSAAGGHPPALLLTRDIPGSPWRPGTVGTPNFMIGVIDDAEFETQQVSVPHGSRLYVYSDGVTEARLNGSKDMLGTPGLADLLVRIPSGESARPRRVLDEVRRLQGRPDFADDFSLLEVVFG